MVIRMTSRVEVSIHAVSPESSLGAGGSAAGAAVAGGCSGGVCGCGRGGFGRGRHGGGFGGSRCLGQGERAGGQQTQPQQEGGKQFFHGSFSRSVEGVAYRASWPVSPVL